MRRSAYPYHYRYRAALRYVIGLTQRTVSSRRDGAGVKVLRAAKQIWDVDEIHVLSHQFPKGGFERVCSLPFGINRCGWALLPVEAVASASDSSGRAAKSSFTCVGRNKMMMARYETAVEQPGRPSTASRLYRRFGRYARRIDRRLRTSDAYRFEQHRPAESLLVTLVLDGQSELWPTLLPYVEEAVDGRYLCVVTPGVYHDGLSHLCEEWGWSYLSTATDDFGLAQNICYKLHPTAELIVKIDDGMFLLPNSIAQLSNRFQRMMDEGIVRPGAVAPIIPLDGLCYRFLLEWLNLLEAFELRFGKASMHATDAVIARNAKAALWVWERTSPLSRTAAALVSQPERLVLAPIRFSAGVIAFERSFWHDMGQFPVFRSRLMIGQQAKGEEAAFFSASAVALSRPIVLTSHVLAGRFSFDRHYDEMAGVFAKRPGMFVV